MTGFEEINKRVAKALAPYFLELIRAEDRAARQGASAGKEDKPNEAHNRNQPHADT